MRNYLIEGVSGTGKSSVCRELERRSYDTVEHDHHIWDVGKVRSLIAERGEAMTFFCDGSRNVAGGKQPERALVVHLHRMREDIPADGVVIDATRPLARVVDEIVRRAVTVR